MDGHVSRKVLKRSHDILDGGMRKLLARITIDIPSPISMETMTSTSIIVTTIQIEKDKVSNATLLRMWEVVLNPITK